MTTIILAPLQVCAAVLAVLVFCQPRQDCCICLSGPRRHLGAEGGKGGKGDGRIFHFTLLLPQTGVPELPRHPAIEAFPPLAAPAPTRAAFFSPALQACDEPARPKRLTSPCCASDLFGFDTIASPPTTSPSIHQNPMRRDIRSSRDPAPGRWRCLLYERGRWTRATSTGRQRGAHARD